MDQKKFEWIIKAINFDQLTTWEGKFVDSCEARMKSKGDLTEAMEEILERIYEERQ